ncbi:hypothetical protein M8C21_000718 [Ambrosia artemisiifolia]|uniref:Dienelactone hydrolase domain-containing protein n=1 Tax=Ambrosia artemisiifolia TaxID=4212 RepID=A0AAD5GRI5_AMBAR|nr:hypothetical protein M8C21_000718 [Ambrosia artemisiifolia]
MKFLSAVNVHPLLSLHIIIYIYIYMNGLGSVKSSAQIKFGPKCCHNPPAFSSRGQESGEVVQIASLSSYVSGNLDSKIAVLLVSDIYGYEAPKLSWFGGKLGFDRGGFDLWQLADKEQAVELAKPVIQALREKGISKIGSAGFCWGGKVVVELAKEAEIQVAALVHPSFVTLDDIKEVKVPIAILSAELDAQNPPELIKEFDAALDANKVYHFVKIYPGVDHGWVIRYNDDNAAEVKSAKEAQQDLVDWFRKAFSV